MRKVFLRTGLAAVVITAALLSGCVMSGRIENSLILGEKGGLIKYARDIVIVTPDSRLPEYEKLTYEMSWMGIPVGTMSTAVTGIKNINGRDAYALEAVAKTNAFFSKIYKIDDRFISYMDIEKLHTLRHEVYRRDGSYKKDAATDFDQINHKAHFKNFLDKSEKHFNIPDNTQDILSACYYFRLLGLKVGDSVEYYVCNNEDNYHFLGLIQSKMFIRLPKIGENEAFQLLPYAKLKGEKVDKGRVNAYFSCDKRRIPLSAVVKGPVFTEVGITLVKVENSPESGAKGKP